MATEWTTAIEVPAPTAWPLVLAVGFTLMFAGLLHEHVGDACSAPCCPSPVVSAGSARSFPREHEEAVPVVAGGPSGHDRASRRRTAGDRARAGARLASRPHVSGLGRREGRMGRQRRDGGAGLWLRAAEGWQHLVSHQSSRGGGLCAVTEARTRAAECVSSRQLRHRRGRARPRLDARRAALRRDAADVPAAADPPRRTDRPGAVVGTAALDSGPRRIRCSRAASTGSGSSRRRWPSASSRASSSFGTRRCRRSRTCRSPCARASRRRERFHREERHAREARYPTVSAAR